MSDEKPDVPDLRSLLREASRPEGVCTVPLKQGLAARIRDAEDDLSRIAADPDAKPRRAATKSPLKAKAEEIEALRAEMAASALTFRFTALSEAERDQIRQDMRGRDEPDETNLRAIAAMCRSVATVDGVEFPAPMTWEDFRDLRDQLGVQVFEETIDAAASTASGVGGWSVPFSSAASRILATGR